MLRSSLFASSSRRRKIAFGALCVSALIAVLAACGSDAASAFGPTSSGAGGDAGVNSEAGFPFSDGASPPSLGAASGVVIVHAASFPQFRLCFENYPKLLPQPDSTIMPQANVVGVDVGSVVRIAPLDDARGPGAIYVIDQRKLFGDRTTRSCEQLLHGNDHLTLNTEYQLAGSIARPLGVSHVDVLAITGCAASAVLQDIQQSSADCSNWDEVSGSLATEVLPLVPTFAATATALPVQLVHLSTILEKVRGDAAIEVTFRDLSDAGGEADEGDASSLSSSSAPQNVATSPPLFDASAPVTLQFMQAGDNPAVYGNHGFRVTVRSKSGDAGSPSSNEDAGDAAVPTASGPILFSHDQTLAEIVELSSPSDIPTTYYLAASNYALLLLGDPRMMQYPDGGTTKGYDARRVVRLLAIPVKDKDPDAGIAIDDGGSVPDANSP